mgnify:CR=1 FL=1
MVEPGGRELIPAGSVARGTVEHVKRVGLGLVRERASDPEWMPPEGGMLDLLFSGDPEAAAVIDHGDGGIARLLQAALARAHALRAAAARAPGHVLVCEELDGAVGHYAQAVRA